MCETFLLAILRTHTEYGVVILYVSCPRNLVGVGRRPYDDLTETIPLGSDTDLLDAASQIPLG